MKSINTYEINFYFCYSADDCGFWFSVDTWYQCDTIHCVVSTGEAKKAENEAKRKNLPDERIVTDSEITEGNIKYSLLPLQCKF